MLSHYTVNFIHALTINGNKIQEKDLIRVKLKVKTKVPLIIEKQLSGNMES